MSGAGGSGMSLGQAQQHFAEMVGKLITFAFANGFGLTFGEAYRTPEQAALDAKAGTGIKDSLHTLRLAIDFNVFVGGFYVTTAAPIKPLGEYFESLGGSWGGRFSEKPAGAGNGKDSNHFSLAYGGHK